MTKQDKQTMNELLKRINSNISTYGNTKPHLGHDGINQVMDFISTIRREAVEEGKKQMIEWLRYELDLAKQEGIDIGEGDDPRLRVNYLISRLELIVEKTSEKGTNNE